MGKLKTFELLLGDCFVVSLLAKSFFTLKYMFFASLKRLLLLPQSSPSGSQSADVNAGKRRDDSTIVRLNEGTRVWVCEYSLIVEDVTGFGLPVHVCHLCPILCYNLLNSEKKLFLSMFKWRKTCFTINSGTGSI